MKTKVTKYPAWKVEQTQRIEELSKTYGVIAAAGLNKVRATQLMALKRDFRGRIEVAVAKNRLAALGLRKSGRPGIEVFADSLTGQNALIFTDFNPFKLFLVLEKNKVNLPARAGDVATEDIMIPAGNTGQAPGPVLSEFKEARVPTKIDAGSIWITKDTVVAKTGNVISPKLAGLLARMGVKPIKAGVSVSMANAEGHNFGKDDIRIDLESYRERLTTAGREALGLALAAAYPVKEALPMLLAKALAQARSLALSASYASKETAGELLAKDDI